MKKILRPYLALESHIRSILLADLFIQLVNSSFFLLLNYLMVNYGYQDHEIANYRSYQYLAVMLLALPLGLLIRGRKVKPLFYIASLLTPAMSLVIIYLVSHRLDNLLFAGFALWGAAYTCIQIPALPFILGNSKKENHSEGIAVFFLTNSTSVAFCGLMNFILNRYFSNVFDVKLLMQCFAILGFGAFFFVSRIKVKEAVSSKIKFFSFSKHYDWKLIFKAMIPTLTIAVGAGFTIPFINLFFLNVHHMGPDGFSLLGSFTFSIVAISIIMVPTIKRRYGYKVAVTLTQSLSVFALIMLAFTQFYSDLAFAVYLAGFFYVVRQPLMNIAGPVTSEVSMYYVGKRNQELMSAINSAMWSGSWFISSQLFRMLRGSGMSYAGVFFITAALYSVGVLLYYLLIKDFEKRKEAGVMDL